MKTLILPQTRGINAAGFFAVGMAAILDEGDNSNSVTVHFTAED